MNQFIHYRISSRRDFGINRNFAVVAIEYSFVTVYRGSIMPRIHRWSVMIYGSLQAEFTETKYNSHIHGYGISVFCFTPCFSNSCMGEVQVGVIYNTPLDSNEGDLSPHASQTIYFCNINENEISDRETPVKLLSFEPQYITEPLLISSIIIIRHSEASSCCSPL